MFFDKFIVVILHFKERRQIGLNSQKNVILRDRHWKSGLLFFMTSTVSTISVVPPSIFASPVLTLLAFPEVRKAETQPLEDLERQSLLR